MKQAQIITALNIGSYKQVKDYCSKLAGICDLITQLKKLPGYGFEVGQVKGNLEYVQNMHVLIEPEIKTDQYGHKSKEMCEYMRLSDGRNNELHFLGKFPFIHPVKVFHGSGSYTFYIPTDNDFYYYCMALMGANVIAEKKESEKPIFEAIVSGYFIQTLKTALPYVGKDALVPAMTGICIQFNNDTYKIAATDAHRLYVSQPGLCDSSIPEPKEFILPLAAAKEIAAIKRKGQDEPIYISVYENDCFEILGVKGKFIDASFPNYPCVIPDNPYTLEVDRSEMISHINQNMSAANKTTNQVIFSLNGNVKISCRDIDMSRESTTSFNYLSSDVPDMDISFNGKLLLEVLKSSKSKKVRIELSTPTRAGIFKDNSSKDMALLMPLMIVV